MDRRSFLGSVAGVAVGGTALGAEPGDAMLGVVARLGAHRDGVERDTRGLVDADAVGLGWYARTAGAMAAIDALAEVPIEDQAHPAVQDFIAAVFTTVGAGIEEAFALFTELAEGEEPDAGRLAAALGEMKRAFGGARVSDVSRRLHANGLDELGGRLGRDGLRGEARRAAKRLGKLRDLARRIAEDPRGTSVLSPADGAFHLRVATGTARWGFVSGRSFSFLEVLGLIGCGIGISYGTLYFVVSVACALTCNAPGLLLVALLSGLVVVGCVYGIIALNRHRMRRTEAWEAESPLVAASPTAVSPQGARVTVSPADGFLAVPGFVLQPGSSYAVLASGFVVLDREGLRLDPTGDPRLDGGAGDLVPGEPIGSLLARVGGVVYPIGTSAILPKGLSGPLEFGVNRSLNPDVAYGSFSVHVERLAE